MSKVRSATAQRCSVPARAAVSGRLLLCLLASTGLAVAAGSAGAQERGGGQVQLDEIVVEGPARASGVPAPFAGGQVAQGSRLGLLGNTETLKSPFSTTSYTGEPPATSRQRRLPTH